jgi:hypothetical protein
LRLRVAGIRAVVESRAQELNELQRSGLMRVFGVRFGSELKEVSLVLFVPHASISPQASKGVSVSSQRYRKSTFHFASREDRSSQAKRELTCPSTAHPLCTLPVLMALLPHFCTMKNTSSTMDVMGAPGVHSSIAIAVLTLRSM